VRDPRPGVARISLSRPCSIAFPLLLAACAVAATGHAQPGARAAAAGDTPAPSPKPVLSDHDRLARGKALYEAGDYAGCATTLGGIFGPEGASPVQDREVAESGRLYYGACLLGSGQDRRADAVFREAIRYNPQAEPNPLDFPRPVVERFEAVRKTMLDEIEREDRKRAERARRVAEKRRRIAARQRARQQKLLALASEETILVQNRRWVAAVPFGVGQFQNRSPTLGWLFLTTELAALGTLVGVVIYELELHAQYGPGIDEDDLNAKLKDARGIWTVALYSFAGLAAGGIVEAQLSFVPEFRHTRRRQLPLELVPQERSTPEPSAGLSVYPMAATRGGGAGLVLVGRF
jgi:hypothetical protein